MKVGSTWCNFKHIKLLIWRFSLRRYFIMVIVYFYIFLGVLVSVFISLLFIIIFCHVSNILFYLPCSFLFSGSEFKVAPMEPTTRKKWLWNPSFLGFSLYKQSVSLLKKRKILTSLCLYLKNSICLYIYPRG